MTPSLIAEIRDVLREADGAFTSGDRSGHDVIMTEEYRRGIETVRSLLSRIEAQGEAPASADQGSGRAIHAEELLAPHKTNLFSGAFGKAWDGILSEVALALASEYSRGIEEAAKICDGRERVMVSAVVAKEHRGADPTVAVAKRDMASELAVAIRQRALTPGGTT